MRALAVLGGWLWPAAALFAAPAMVYETWQPPAFEAHDEQRLLVLHLRSVAAHAGVELTRDRRLSAVAHDWLPWARDHAGAALPMEALRQSAWRHGLTDGELGLLAVRSRKDGVGEALLTAWRHTLADGTDVNRIGVAVAAADGDDAAIGVVAFSRRLLTLAPIVLRGRAGQQVWLEGRCQGRAIRRLRLALEGKEGSAHSIDVPLLAGHFRASLGTVGADLPSHVQLLVERGRGPEVAAEFPLEQPGATAEEKAPPAHAPRGLVPLVYGLRAAHGLSLPALCPELVRLAAMHAEDMAGHHFFAHVSPTRGNAAARLRAARLPFARVVENLAAAEDAEQAFVDWQHSPSHLENLLDPTVDRMGFASARDAATDEPVFVLLMTRSPPPAGHRTRP